MSSVDILGTAAILAGGVLVKFNPIGLAEPWMWAGFVVAAGGLVTLLRNSTGVGSVWDLKSNGIAGGGPESTGASVDSCNSDSGSSGDSC
jgi:hypothetical protein